MALLEHMRRYFFPVLLPVALWVLTGCTTIRTEHHIVLDHNITIKIEKEVEDFLDDLYGDEEETAPPAAPEATPPKEKE